MFSVDWLSCETFAERVSRSLDGQLSWQEKPAYYVRLALCMTSRRFRRQMYAMEEIAKKRGQIAEDELDDSTDDPELCLGADAQARFQAALHKQLH